jgi:nitroimidazol reductase NimA-like FMN-containing flavoprotein (pyridoxamine 5'-phosphate oxidase superfamily)
MRHARHGEKTRAGSHHSECGSGPRLTLDGAVADGDEDGSMPATPNVGPSKSADESMSVKNSEALLRRACFGHLAFARDGHADVLPIRYTFLEGWVYFRADLGLSEVIAHNPWLVLSVTEFQDANLVSTVIVRGGCYQTEQTGTTIGDAAALRGIMELRDRAAGPERKARGRRSSTVFRLHVDEMRGITALVPCPARDRSFDDRETQHSREARRDQTAAEDTRAAADGVAAANPPRRRSRRR